MATKYIDNRLLTGANDGSSAANAWRSLFDAQRGTISAGDVVEVVAGSGPYYEATVTTAGLKVDATDISFDAASKEIRTAGAVSFSSYNTAGKILRIFGSQLNDGQYVVASATATVITLAASCRLRDESAGNRVRVTDITASNIGNARAMCFDQGRNGSSGNPITWNFNDCEISAGWPLTNDKHMWVRSAANPSEWYVLKSDGSNPSLNRPESAVVNGHFMCASAGDTNRNRGTVGSLSFSGQYGFGDNDSLGFNTVYVKATDNPKSLGWTIVVGQLFFAMGQNWGDHVFNRARFSFGNGNADGTANGCCVMGRGLRLRWNRCVFMFADGHGFEPNASGPFILEQCVGYWTGHRFCNAGSAAVTTSLLGCVDWSAHLFLLIGASATSSTILNVYGCISANNEAGAIDKKGASAILNEGFNCWYPRMTATNGALGYISPTNWPKTAATDLPPATLTTVSSQSSLYDPAFKSVSDLDFDDCDWKLSANSPCIGRGPFRDANRTQFTDFYDVVYTAILNMGVSQAGSRPVPLGARVTA